jgi:hypothetical protein
MIDKVAVDRTTSELGEAGVYVPEPRYYPEYTPDVHCRSGSVRLEVTNLREIRRKLVYDWEDRTGPRGNRGAPARRGRYTNET